MFMLKRTGRNREDQFKYVNMKSVFGVFLNKGLQKYYTNAKENILKVKISLPRGHSDKFLVKNIRIHLKIDIQRDMSRHSECEAICIDIWLPFSGFPFL